MRLQSAKCLVGNSIIDGLKSRLMQYLKHVVEDDVLFTKVISKFKPITFVSFKTYPIFNKKFLLHGGDVNNPVLSLPLLRSHDFIRLL